MAGENDPRREELAAAWDELKQSASDLLGDIWGAIRGETPDIDQQKRELRLMLARFQPNAGGEELEEVASALWDLYERWVVRGPSELPDNWVDGIDMEQLSRVLLNASAHAHVVFNYLEGLNPEGRIASRKRASVMRYAATLRDSLEQVSRLVVGEELEEPEPREFENDDTQVHISEPVPSEDPEAILAAYHAIPREGQQIRSAYAYTIMKRCVAHINSPRWSASIPEEDRLTVADDLHEAMDVITGRKSVPNGDN